jgi:DNA uptake protein ComE-like DNA-binding protein
MKQTLWKELFNFSRQERIGIVVLMILIGLCNYAPAIWEPFNIPDAHDTTFFTFREKPVVKAAPHIATLFRFDPNTLAEKDWVKLGVSPRTVQTIQHYLAKGGRFRKKEDLQRIYGLPLAEYKRLEPYVLIAKSISSPPNLFFQSIPGPRSGPGIDWKNKLKTIDINEADSAAWESLSGIGPVLAGRIIRFRDKLGGFYAISQIRETYGLPDSTFVKIQASLQLNKVSLKNLDINQLDEKSLASHPYIRYKLARLIVLYRNNNGPFRRAEELLGIPLVDDSIYRKLEPYIKTIN